MKKWLCKHKKIILLCLVFFMSFNIITDYKQKETYAIAGVDDALLWALGLLILSTGVVAINSEQITDMGAQVYDKLSLDEKAYKEAIYGTAEQQAENDEQLKQRFIKVTDKLKEIINDVASTLTDEPVTKTNSISTDVFEMSFSNTVIPDSTEDKYNLSEFIITVNNTSNVEKTITLRSSTDNMTSTTVNVYPGLNKIGLSSYNRVGSSDSYKYYVHPVRFYNDYYSIKTALVSKAPVSVCLDIPSTVELVSTDVIETIPYDNPVIKEGYNPTYTDENLKAGTYIPIPQSVPTDTAISTDIPLTWDKAIDTGLVTDIPATKVGDFTGDITGEVTGSLETGLDISIPNVFEMLKDLLIYLFYPTVSVSDLFSIPAGSGFANLSNLFNWDILLDIEPKPYEFITDLNMNTLLEESEGSKTWHIEIKLFDTQFMKNNIGIVRNVLSYSLLISVIYFVIYHFIPRRDMD